MIVFFGKDGEVKEIVSSYTLGNGDTAFRKTEGNSGSNFIYCYYDGRDDSSVTTDNAHITFADSYGNEIGVADIAPVAVLDTEIKFDKSRKLRFFEYEKTYHFAKFEISDDVLANDGSYTATSRLVIDGAIYANGLITFNVAKSAVLKESFITQSQYDYIVKNMTGKISVDEANKKFVPINALSASLMTQVLNRGKEVAIIYRNPSVGKFRYLRVNDVGYIVYDYLKKENFALINSSQIGDGLAKTDFSTTMPDAYDNFKFSIDWTKVASVASFDKLNKVMPTDIAYLNGFTLVHDSEEITGQENKIKLGDGLTYDDVTHTIKAVSSEALNAHMADYDNPHKVTKAQVGLENVANKPMDSTPTEGSTNYVTSSGVKSYVDNALSGISAGIEYRKVDSLPIASKETLGAIYLVKDTHTDSDDSYDEYITISNDDGTYSWEKIGNTDIDLSDYYTKEQVDELIANDPTIATAEANFSTSATSVTNFVVGKTKILLLKISNNSNYVSLTIETSSTTSTTFSGYEIRGRNAYVSFVYKKVVIQNSTPTEGEFDQTTYRIDTPPKGITYDDGIKLSYSTQDPTPKFDDTFNVASDGTISANTEDVEFNEMELNPSGDATQELSKLSLDGIIYSLGGSGGTEVVANPGGTPSQKLTTIKIDGVDYQLDGGTKVEANPSGSATDTLEKVTIGTTTYAIPQQPTDYVPNTRKINNKALTADITLKGSDIGVGASADSKGNLNSVTIDGTIYPVAPSSGAQLNVENSWTAKQSFTEVAIGGEDVKEYEYTEVTIGDGLSLSDDGTLSADVTLNAFNVLKADVNSMKTGKQDTLGNGDVKSDMIATNAITEDKLSVDIANKVKRAYQIPTTTPTILDLCGVDSTGAQVNVELGDGVSYDPTTHKISATGGGGGKLYYHSLLFSVIPDAKNKLYCLGNVISKTSTSFNSGDLQNLTFMCTAYGKTADLASIGGTGLYMGINDGIITIRTINMDEGGFMYFTFTIGSAIFDITDTVTPL